MFPLESEDQGLQSNPDHQWIATVLVSVVDPDLDSVDPWLIGLLDPVPDQ